LPEKDPKMLLILALGLPPPERPFSPDPKSLRVAMLTRSMARAKPVGHRVECGHEPSASQGDH